MNFKDIVNRDIVNLTNCDHEPIHIPGSIQPHGFLLAISPKDWNIHFCSENTTDFIGVSHAELLGKNFGECFGSDQLSILIQYTANGEMLAGLPLKLTFGPGVFQCTIHQSAGYLILEGEPNAINIEQLANIYSQTVQFVSYMNSTSTLQELCNLVANGTRDITGYDRVMVYRFDKEYNGEVFAESCREDLEPFVGLHYPHTDIPTQARELYLKNLIRLIADINYRPVPIFTIDDGAHTNLDLSLSILRSTSPIHVKYLQNMGVGATLTISLIHRGRLWGLIACHHYSKKNITPETRLAAQLQGQFITSQIDVRQSNEEYDIARKTNIALEKLNSFYLPPVTESFKIISINKDLLRVCNAMGAAIVVNGEVFKNGLTPGDQSILELCKWLSDYSNDGTFHTDKIVNFVPDMKEVCETVAGVIFHSLGNHNSIIWFRPETQHEVHWGGDPNKAIIKDANGLHPRNSFKLWKQVVKCRSNDWLQPELNAAANYAHSLQNQISMMMLSDEEEKYRKLSEILKETNSELENINWISTHDLQEPLRKIQLISSRLLATDDGKLPANVADSLQRMNASAGRMQTLLVDILKYTRIKYAEDAFETVDLNDILEDVLPEIGEMIKEKSAAVNAGNLPVVRGIPFLLKQLFSNLILNSLKYASEERDPVITISSEGEKNRPTVTFSDNGIGFEQKYADTIFNIFTRLHSHGDYKGSGVGLALCKKIMKTHGGSITAKGQAEQGAAFTLHFPGNE